MHSNYMNVGTKNTIVYVFILVVASQCETKPEKLDLKGPDGLNMKAVSQFKLPLELDEISGIAYYPLDSSIFAVNDEKGWLYKIKRGTEIKAWEFFKGADFEDIVLLDSIFYVLQSNGNIIRLSFSQQNTLAVQVYYFDQGGENKNEFEILYYDSTKNKLILLCKDCESDKKKSLTTFSFDPSIGKYTGSDFTINVSEIAAAIGEEKIKFKPSAASVNPKNGLLYIISAINKLLVITDVNGNFKNVYRIDPGIFKQPEGITFTPSGGMIVSNEAADVGVADILYFSYN
ncbi:MAG: SdiA-regulated domain-containing protein [Chitinophagaceae bacterium]